ncbi:c-type cytochrome [Bacillus sp. T33-2]|uniref:c-type cytochrome n=1 Tax=Bacillus sp. T33-2 TaxID=2054168 RepID=UPI000C767EA3|nr:c-type cytochrome [Bacillus sp. T33-2]PLR99901.1 cytochrome c [Bacillus sp. T33-2]
MRKLLIGFAVFATIVIIAFLSHPAEFRSKEELASINQGQKLYTQLCSACHGQSGKGEGKLAGTAINNQHFLSTFSDKDIHNQIKFGRREGSMPEYGSILTDKQLDSLVSFIRSWQTKPLELEAPTALDGNPSNGKRLYSLYCSNCHGNTGSGLKSTGSALAHPNFLKYTNDEQIWISVAYGRQETRMGPSLKGLDGVRQLEKQQISDITTYIRKELINSYNPEESRHHETGQNEVKEQPQAEQEGHAH